MIKKIIIFLGIILIIFFSINLYMKRAYQSVECWWGVMYPPLSSAAMIDEEEITESRIRYSSLDTNYLYVANEDYIPIKYKFAIIEWLKEKFSF